MHVCNVSVYMSLELYVCVKALCRASHTAAAASGIHARVWCVCMYVCMCLELCICVRLIFVLQRFPHSSSCDRYTRVWCAFVQSLLMRVQNLMQSLHAAEAAPGMHACLCAPVLLCANHVRSLCAQPLTQQQLRQVRVHVCCACLCVFCGCLCVCMRVHVCVCACVCVHVCVWI